MDFKEVVRDRYSCKKFSDKQVEKEKIDAILEAGRLAPTAKNLQEQRIYVVQSAENLAKIDGESPCRYNAPTVLVVAFDKNNVFTYPGEKRDSGVEDATIVATHLILAAKNEGVDSCWVNYFDPEKMASALGLPANEEVLMLLDLGYAAEGAGPLDNHNSRKAISETVSSASSSSNAPRISLFKRLTSAIFVLIAVMLPCTSFSRMTYLEKSLLFSESS